jgi:vancomycin permeability regulator SanA
MYMIKRVVFLVMKCIVALILVGLIAVIGIDGYVTSHVSSRIITPEQAQELKDVDCILVLGCLVKDNGTPSDMLHDRLRMGVELYKAGVAPKLLMSGDHGRTNYDEVAAMKQFAIDADVPSSDVFMDHAGFSTYESLYRARDIFKADKIIIVSQEYHLYRALYIAEQLGVEAYGVSADYRNYSGQTGRDIREVLARVKDVLSCIFKVEPTYLGEVIPVSGNGDVTNDETNSFYNTQPR